MAAGLRAIELPEMLLCPCPSPVPHADGVPASLRAQPAIAEQRKQLQQERAAPTSKERVKSGIKGRQEKAKAARAQQSARHRMQLVS